MFRNQLQVGDILIVPKGNSLFRAIGIVEGNSMNMLPAPMVATVIAARSGGFGPI